MKSIEDLPAQVIAEMLISHIEVLVERGDVEGADEVWSRISLPGVSSIEDLRRHAAKLDDGTRR